MAELTYPADLRYTPDHEWAKKEGDLIVVGITAFAQDSLGDVVFVELPAPGTKIKKGEPFGVVESTKAVSELYAPMSGEIIARNDALPDATNLINSDPYGAAWMIKVKPAEAGAFEGMLDQPTYVSKLG